MSTPESHCNAPVAPDREGYGFARRDWFDMLARHCFSGSHCLWPRAESAGTAATLPLVEQNGHLGALANYYSFAYAPIFEGTPSPARRQALISTIAAALRQRYDRISFYPLIDDAETRISAGMMRNAFASAGWIALLTDQNSNHYLDLKERDFATYWAQRPGRLRSGVRRKGKASPYDFAVHGELTEELWRDYLAVYASSWKNAEPFPDMVRAIAEDAAARGVLRLAFARDGEKAVAAQLWTIEGRTACVHKMAHSTAHDRYSPGTLLSHHMFEHMIDRESIGRIDYGTGNNAYKRDWMEDTRPMLRLDCFNPRKARMWLPALRTRISQLVRRPG